MYFAFLLLLASPIVIGLCPPGPSGPRGVGSIKDFAFIKVPGRMDDTDFKFAITKVPGRMDDTDFKFAITKVPGRMTNEITIPWRVGDKSETVTIPWQVGDKLEGVTLHLQLTNYSKTDHTFL